MKGDGRVTGYLNQALTHELTAINQYFLHSRMFKNWGLQKLSDYEYKESIDEMKHADSLFERVLFLEGLPNVQQINKILIGENVQEILSCDLLLEDAGRPLLIDAIAYCEQSRGYIRELFESILGNEEEHIDWLETQLALIQRIGLANYTQSQI